jgi:hypothetical protein
MPLLLISNFLTFFFNFFLFHQCYNFFLKKISSSFFLVKPGYPRRWPRLIPWPGWQGLPKRPSADEEEGRTLNLVSDESMPTAPPGPLGLKKKASSHHYSNELWNEKVFFTLFLGDFEDLFFLIFFFNFILHKFF